MKIQKLPGRVNWYHGNGNDIAIGRFYCLDDDRTKVDVFIRDRLGNITYQIGDGRQIDKSSMDKSDRKEIRADGIHYWLLEKHENEHRNNLARILEQQIKDLL